jgi:hypothetical protein
MKNNGTKDPKIQNIILEECTKKVGNDGKKLFLELYNFYKKGPTK